MRRLWLIAIAGTLGLAAVTAFFLYYYSGPTTLTVAVSPPKGDDVKLMQAIAAQLNRDRANVRLRVVEKETPQDAGAALDKRDVDLAVVRRDLGLPLAGQAVTVLRKNMVMILALPDSGVKKIGDLVGRRVGIVGRGNTNMPLLDAILTHYELLPRDVLIIPLEPEAVAGAVRERKVDVLVVGAPPAGREMTEALVAASADGRSPTFIPITEADALAQRIPVYESVEILAGAFGGTPPRPAETVETIGYSYYLVASNSVDEQTVGELARLLLAARPLIAGEFPVANHIKAPDTDKDAAVAVHPGAAAYYDGDQKSFFDRYSDAFYLGVMLISILGSAAAAVAGYARTNERSSRPERVHGLLDLLARAREAGTPEDLDRLQGEADQIVIGAVGDAQARHMDETSLRAFGLALDQVRHAIAERRGALQRQA